MLYTYLFYPMFAFLTIIMALLIIPKNLYKKCFLYGFLFGGLGDTLIAIILSALHLIEYKNMGPFNLFGIFSFWTPIAWAFAFSIFFYLLPVRKLFLIPYLILFAGISYSVGLIMETLGFFAYHGFQIYLAPVVFFVWYSVSAWIYLKYENLSLR